LGRIKFLFKNNHAVYLHDTPSKWNFDIDKRSLSSGCVRVQDPFDLAQYVFEIVGNDISQDKINEILKSEKTNNISVSKVPVQIHQLYWTIQIDKNGKIKLLDDLYDLDKDLYKKLNTSKG
jgi:murein L,D-transpeptidase YcbB/YkuD